MNPTATTPKHWTASELRKLPADQRDAILQAAAAEAEHEYRNDPELTAFDAFGKDDLHGDSAATEAR
jgi:hypothetical protein